MHSALNRSERRPGWKKVALLALQSSHRKRSCCIVLMSTMSKHKSQPLQSHKHNTTSEWDEKLSWRFFSSVFSVCFFFFFIWPAGADQFVVGNIYKGLDWVLLSRRPIKAVSKDFICKGFVPTMRLKMLLISSDRGVFVAVWHSFTGLMNKFWSEPLKSEACLEWRGWVTSAPLEQPCAFSVSCSTCTASHKLTPNRSKCVYKLRFLFFFC